MLAMALNKLLLALLIAAFMCTAAAQSTSPELPSAAAGTTMPSPAGQGATQPAATTGTAALPPASAATASKKFPLPGEAGGAYLPGAEVASALPEPTPDELPSAASLGFGGHGDECCGGGGYGWFGGPGGFGPGTYGYSGPLYFGAAPPARDVLLPLAMACVSAAAAMYYL